MLGLDIGARRVGVAISRSGVIAEPLKSLTVGVPSQRLEQIRTLVRVMGATTVVIGLPYRADGSLSEHGTAVHQLVADLRQAVPTVTVVTADESLTSKEAERLGGRRADHDALAATLILEQYLAESRRR